MKNKQLKMGDSSKVIVDLEQGDDSGQFVQISVEKEDIINSQYSHWYEQFKDHVLNPVTIIRPLPKEFLQYLESDGISLPKGAPHESALFQKPTPNSDNEYSDWDDDDDDDDKLTDSKSDPTDDFKQLHLQIKDIIKEYKSVAPKLNWSSPQDATWIMTNKTMQCFSPSDLYLLLKSSDYINHDLYHAFDGLETPDDFQFELVLRKWVNINPSMEFRCFVHDRQLIGISQRDLNYYSFLDEAKDELLEKIGIFFDDVLMAKVDSNSFVFDVYIPKPLNNVYLVDINPFSRKTDSLLFSWHELATMKPEHGDVDFRLVTEYNSGRFITKAHSQNHVPRDFLEAGSNTATMVEFLKKMKEMELQDSISSGDDDDDADE